MDLRGFHGLQNVKLEGYISGRDPVHPNRQAHTHPKECTGADARQPTFGAKGSSMRITCLEAYEIRDPPRSSSKNVHLSHSKSANRGTSLMPYARLFAREEADSRMISTLGPCSARQSQ